MGDYTDFLFARPTFVEGVASVIDLFGLLQEYNRSRTPEEADSWALWNDFHAVGEDIKGAIDTYNRESEVNVKP